jgi:Tol biopolymer transport system component
MKISLFSILLMAGLLFAQDNGVRVISDLQSLQLGSSHYAMNPSWSPNDDYLAYTGSNHQGLYLYSFATENSTMLNNEPFAGYGFSWSGDGKDIAVRVARREGRRQLLGIKVISIADGSEREISPFESLMPGTPVWVAGDSQVLLNGSNKLNLFTTGKPVNKTHKAFQASAPFRLKDEIAIADLSAKKYQKMKPTEGRYLNVTPSPDGKQIAFEVVGGNMFVMDSDGGNLIDLGRGEEPSWSPDSKWLCYRISSDDGHQYLSSEIYVIRADGEFKTSITSGIPTMAFHPDWANASNRIAFNNLNGEILILEIALP